MMDTARQEDGEFSVSKRKSNAFLRLRRFPFIPIPFGRQLQILDSEFIIIPIGLCVELLNQMF